MSRPNRVRNTVDYNTSSPTMDNDYQHTYIFRVGQTYSAMGWGAEDSGGAGSWGLAFHSGYHCPFPEKKEVEIYGTTQ